jgi:hypothetical protein
MHPTEPSRAEALAAMTPEKLEEMARPAPRASHPGLRDLGEALAALVARSSGSHSLRNVLGRVNLGTHYFKTQQGGIAMITILLAIGFVGLFFVRGDGRLASS